MLLQSQFPSSIKRRHPGSRYEPHNKSTDNTKYTTNQEQYLQSLDFDMMQVHDFSMQRRTNLAADHSNSRREPSEVSSKRRREGLGCKESCTRPVRRIAKNNEE